MHRTAVIKKDAWRLAAPSAVNANPQREEEKGEKKRKDEPKIHCVQEGGRITKIIVTCSCGEKMELSCVYEDNTKEGE